MINKEFKRAIESTMINEHDESVYNILNLLESFTGEGGINLSDVREQIQCMIEEIDCYVPEPNDLKRINLLCETYKLNS